MLFNVHTVAGTYIVILVACLAGCVRSNADTDSVTDLGNERTAVGNDQPARPALARSEKRPIEPGTELTEDGFREAIQNVNAKYVIVQVFQEGCGPCITEALRLTERQDSLRRMDVEIVGMGMDETADACKKFYKQAGERIAFPLYLAPWFAEQRDVFMTPTLFIFGTDGNVLFRADPEQAEDGVMAAMDKELARLMGE